MSKKDLGKNKKGGMIMKKMFYFVAVATFALLSCQQDEDPVNNVTKNDPVTFKASIENLGTRADMDASNGLKWVADDKIGIYVNDVSWNDKNQPFTLVGNGGSATGEFAWDNGKFTNTNATVAFFPWQGIGSDKNNVYDGTMYFKLPGSYDNYTSGKMLTPLVAKLESSSSEIHFKHAGAAVKVTINNVPAGAKNIGMIVDGVQIWGNYKINPANAGTDALILDGNANLNNNSVWLIYATQETPRKLTFIFPVPSPITNPKLSFEMWDDNNIPVWKKNLKAQTKSIGRADVLEMPAIDIEPYSHLGKSEHWTLYAKINGEDWRDYEMREYTDNNGVVFRILPNVTFKAGDAFKIRKDGAWDESYPSSNYEVNEDCTKSVFFKFDNGNVYTWLR